MIIMRLLNIILYYAPWWYANENLIIAIAARLFGTYLYKFYIYTQKVDREYRRSVVHFCTNEVFKSV